MACRSSMHAWVNRARLDAVRDCEAVARSLTVTPNNVSAFWSATPKGLDGRVVATDRWADVVGELTGELPHEASIVTTTNTPETVTRRLTPLPSLVDRMPKGSHGSLIRRHRSGGTKIRRHWPRV